MNKLVMVAIYLSLLSSCEPREVDTINIRQSWQIVTVKENGKVVYDIRNLAGGSRAYSRFMLDLREPKTVKMTDKGGVQLLGNWSLSKDYKKVHLSNMTKTYTEEFADNIEFEIIESAGKNLLLRRTIMDDKTGRVYAEYHLNHN